MAYESMFSTLRQQLGELDCAKVIIGVQGEPGKNFHGDTVSASDELQKIAWVHEYGMDVDVTPKMRTFLHDAGIRLKAKTARIHIPERSYIRRAQAEGKAEFAQFYSKLIGRMLEGEITADDLLNRFGKTAMEFTFTELGHDVKPVTESAMKQRKGNPDPPVDTGSGIQNHITYRIEKKGGSGSDTTFAAGGTG